MTLDSKCLFVCAFLVPACVDTKLIGETTPGQSTSTSDDGLSTETTTASPTESSSTEPPDASSSTNGGSSDSTGGGVVGEWVGLYDSGFGNAYITPCGETDLLSIEYASGIPGYEICQATSGGNETEIWIRVRGTRVEGEYGPKLQDVELLEGPCLVASCGEGATFDDCYDFDTLCWPLDPLCDPYVQDCPNGMKCSMVLSPEQFDCVEEGVLGDGEACVRAGGLDDCAEGLLCATKDLGGDGAGTCAELCANESHCSAPDTTCMLDDDGIGVDVGVCVPA